MEVRPIKVDYGQWTLPGLTDCPEPNSLRPV